MAVLISGASDRPDLVIRGARTLTAPGVPSSAGGDGVLRLHAGPLGLIVQQRDKPPRPVHHLSLQPQARTLTVSWGTGTDHKAISAPITVSTYHGRLWVVADIEESVYLGGVLVGEISPGAPWEALKAQAIVARSFLYQSQSRHGTLHALVCDQSHCQRFVPEADPKLSRAVSDTQGLVVTDLRQTPVPVYYHATCGGSTASVRQVFGGADWPHLRGVEDAVCATEPVWQATKPLSACLSALKAADLFVPAGATDLTLTDRSESGWPITLTVAAPLPKQVDAYAAWLAFGQAWGWGMVPGLHYDLHRDGDSVHFRGRGLGHGVGLCQRGAMRWAAKGLLADTILAHSSPGTEVHRR